MPHPVSKATAPDFDFDIRADEYGELAVVEQDTNKDFSNKARALLAFRPGDRDDLPEFGSPSPLGRRIPIDVRPMEEAVAQWIPEGNYHIRSDGEGIQVEVDEPSVDQ